MDGFSLFIGLFIGLFAGLGLGSMTVMLVFVYGRFDFSTNTDDVSTDEDEQITFEHL